MRRHPRKLLAALVVVVLAAVAVVLLHDGSGFADVRGLGDVRARLDERVPAALRDADVPGAAVAVVHEGRVVWTHGYGVADARTKAPMTDRTRLQVGSLSKPVTAWGVVTTGKPALDEPARPWPLAGSGAGVTARRLLSHTAGLSVGGYQGVAPPTPAGTTAQSLAGTGGEGAETAVRSVAEPGKELRYSGGGYTVLQAVLEAQAGEPFARWAAGAVLRPLGMADSAFDRPGDLATGHDARGRPVPSYRYAELAAAGLTSTARDMGRFTAAVAREPDRLGVPQPGTDGHWGLGMETAELGDGTRKLWHEGVNRGWHARLVVYPGRGWGAVVLTNGDGGKAVADAVEDAFED